MLLDAFSPKPGNTFSGVSGQNCIFPSWPKESHAWLIMII